MNLKAVFIDVGNTLLYEKPSRFEIYAAAAREHGLEVSAERMRQLMQRAHTELPAEIDGAFRYSDDWFQGYIQRIFGDYLEVPVQALDGLRAGLFQRFSDPDTFHLFPGAERLLEDARQRGLGLGIISNWSARLPALLERLGLASKVDFVLCSAIERLEKPDAAIFEAALERAGVSAKEALHAGDHPEKDVSASRAAGLSAVLVDHHEVNAGHDSPRVTSLPALSRYIEQI